MINIDDIKNFTESDVEMKIVLPLLKNNFPEGLNYKDYHIQTKPNIKQVIIDKGTSSKIYYPDFVIVIEGLPLIIIEVKKPGEDLIEGYRQACLYANEINRSFPHKINPCNYVIASDGMSLLAGNSDSNATSNLKYENFNATDIEFDKFLKLFEYNSMIKEAKLKRAALGTEKKFKNPINLLGGKKIQNLEANNSFGENISIQYDHLFNPKIEEEKEEIVKYAYVKQNKIESYITPIDIIFQKKLYNHIASHPNDSSDVNEITSKFDKPEQLNNKVLLLIGSVGSGKSTFTTYLREVALCEDIRKKTIWINLNLNDAPLNKEEIYKWTKNNIINNIKKIFNTIDFAQLNFLLALYQDKIDDLKKGILQLFSPEDIEYKKILAENLQKFTDDVDLTLRCLIQKLISEKDKNLVVVLDNCDKRNSDQQLLMFEVSNWIKDNIKAIVFLPLRETTYENHKYEKPLDTVIKDLIFKINPPSLEQVLQQRISYISKLNNTHKDEYYFLSNGIKVKYPSKNEESYLKSILKSLFESQFFNTLISGFAGRNIRNGIDIFLDFCRSGHINEAEITKMINSEGDYPLPNHLVSKVFIRGNRVYYTDEKSRVKNLFNTSYTEKFKDPFIRISILKYLFDKRNETEVKKFDGYVKTITLVKYLNIKGHDENKVIEELRSLLRLNLIENETLNSDEFDINDLIKITIIGIANLKIVRNIDYLASVAEDTWYKDEKIATEVSSNIAGNGSYAHLSIHSVSNHARILVNYLEEYYKSNFLPLQKSISSDIFEPVDFLQLNQDIDDFDKNIKTNTISNLNSNVPYEASIVNIQHYGMICEIIDTPFFGLLHSSELSTNFTTEYNIGMVVNVQIKEFASDHNKYNLKLA